MVSKVGWFLGAAMVCISFGIGYVTAEQQSARPAVVSKTQAGGAIFERPDTVRTVHDDGHVTLDVTSLMSSDGKFASGMYRSGRTRYDLSEGYGVDEFMYFLEGSVTLTSTDGTRQVIQAGEALTIPKEWQGVWETEGYTKFWVIYSADGSALQ